MRIKPLSLILLALVLCGAGATVASRAQNDSERWLSVEVTDDAGQPLKNACVTVVPKEGEIVFRKSDKRGHVKLNRLAAGSYRVVVKVDGYEAQKREVMVAEKGETVAFHLQPRAN